MTEKNQGGLIDICDIFNRNGSDKDRNGCLQIYHCLFDKMRNETVKILTIGSTDESLKALQEYFVNGEIVSTKKEDEKFDIIIDDGSGDDMDQISTLRNLYSYLKDDGVYIIEELSVGNKLVQCPSLVGCLCNHDSYFFAGIKNNICVIQKHHLNSKRRIY